MFCVIDGVELRSVECMWTTPMHACMYVCVLRGVSSRPLLRLRGRESCATCLEALLARTSGGISVPRCGVCGLTMATATSTALPS